MKRDTTPDYILELKGYRVTTIEIIYCLPDHPDLLQVFVWQTLDLAPNFPRLQAFLKFWKHHIEARMISITITQGDKVSQQKTRFARGEFSLS